MVLKATDDREKCFIDFFSSATGGFTPYDWQQQVAIDGLPDILPVPTGLGKTEVVPLKIASDHLHRGPDRRGPRIQDLPAFAYQAYRNQSGIDIQPLGD